jgi:GT2 family glycosyltransferase
VRLSVLIPTLRRPEILRETLESILEADPLPDEVLVIDGDPEESARRVVDELRPAGGRPDFRFLASRASVTRQRNDGIDVATGDVIVFLDDDVGVDPKLFATLGGAYSEEEIVGATGRVVEPAAHRIGGYESRLRRMLFAGVPEGSFAPFGYPRYSFHGDREMDVEFMPGCLMSVRRDAARLVRFDETLGGYALAEDEDFSYRLSRAGRIRFLPDAVVEHKKTGFSTANAYEFGRKLVVNRTYLFRKNFRPNPWRWMQFGVLFLLLLAHRLVNREWAGARGLLAGIRDAWILRRPVTR